MAKIKIGGVMKSPYLSEISVLGIPSRPGTAAAILGALGKNGINVQFIVQCLDENAQDHVVFCVNQDDFDAALTIVDEVKGYVEASSVVSNPSVATISIFGPDFRERPAIAGTMFKALAAQGINILAISTSISTVSCVIDADHLAQAVTSLTETFDLP
ncbi:MAG: ACT domain-containing protein [Anaerolineae bacterium]|nr:ACT domain-containing protein [Anaerolineae bacterium]